MLPDNSNVIAHCHRPARQQNRQGVAKFLLRTLEFAFYRLLTGFVDRLSRLPRDGCTACLSREQLPAHGPPR